MYPFRCSKCQSIVYSPKVTEPPKCCEESKILPLVNICLLIPCPEGQTPVHTSTPSPGVVDHSQKWIVACGKEKLPNIHTSEPGACTCKSCRDYISNEYKKLGWDTETEDLQDPSIKISLPEDDCGCP